MTVISFRRPIVLVQGRPADGRQQFDRYTQINIDVTFYDYTGAIVTPASATATFSYRTVADGCIANASYAMTLSGTTWSYAWDSSVAQRGNVSCHVESATLLYAVDFRFRLMADLANREKAGDGDFFNYN